MLTNYHNKKYNMIIVNKEESTATAWEGNTETIDKVRDFFADELGVEGARDMPIVNAHRIGMRKTIVDPVNGTSLTTRPIIVRFGQMPDKEKVQKKLTELKTLNRSIPYKQHRVFVTDQLPRRMEDQRKALLAKYKEARARKVKAKWSVDKTGNYCLSLKGCKFSLIS